MPKKIIANGIDVSECQYYNKNGKCRIPHFENKIKYVSCNCLEWDCEYKQLQEEKFENLNNKQKIKSAEKYIKALNNIIHEMEFESIKTDKYEQALKKINKLVDSLLQDEYDYLSDVFADVERIKQQCKVLDE